MEDKNKKRDPMPPPDATPEEIGEFWDTHSLADYWDETHEVEFQVNLKSPQDLSSSENRPADQGNALSAEQGWRKLKELIQSMKPADFEKLTATLLTSFLEDRFVVARSGDQPRGDARSVSHNVSIQAKRYTGGNLPDVKTIEGDIGQARRDRALNLQTYVLAVSRDTEQLSYELDAIARETSVDIVTLELSDELSDLGALCVTFWEDIRHFFDLSNTSQEFLAWIQKAKDDSKTKEKVKGVRSKLEDGIQTQKHVQKDIEEYLLERFSTDTGFNSINLSEAIERETIESRILDWWETTWNPVCCLEGEEGYGKSWLAAKCMNTIRENENIVTFWLDSKDWKSAESISHLLCTCFSSIYPSYAQAKITKLQNKPAKIWRKTLIVLDGVNEWNAIEAAQRILSEYFRHSNELTDRVRFLLTIRSLDNYPSFKSYLPEDCHKISVDPFNDFEFQKALTQKGLQLDDLPDSLKDIARIPRYFQRCAELRDELGSFDVVTKEMVLLVDLSDKIKHSDPQVKEKLGWFRLEDPKNFFLHLAKQIKWDKIDAAPEKLGQSLKECFSDYSKIRLDLAEQGIVRNAEEFDVKLNTDHVLLCWALYLSSLFDSVESTRVEDLLERFQQELEPILQEDVRTEALFAALQLSAIFPNTNLSQEQRSQKRAALMLAWFHSHNAQITDDRLSFWAEKDTDAYAQVVEFEFRHHNSLNYEDTLIEPLAKTWLNKKGDLNRLAARLTKWLLPTYTDDTPEDVVYTHTEGQRSPREKDNIQFRLLDAAISVLSQRPDYQLLEALARCYGILQNNTRSRKGLSRLAQFDETLGKLMRWNYTEVFLDDLCSLEERPQADEFLLKGVERLKTHFNGVNVPRFNVAIDRIRNHEQLLTSKSPETNANCWYYGLDCLAVRKDLLGLCGEDQDELKRILCHISTSAELKLSESLIPWIAKYEFESYAKFACDFKITALNPKYPSYTFLTTEGLIFQEDDCERITEAILEMKENLAQGKDFRSDVELLTSLLTEVLLFSASEEQLTGWFEFLASHESLRKSIFYEAPSILLEALLPKSIVEFVQRKLEASPSNQFASDTESEKITEGDFWSWIYLCASDNDETTVTWAFENLKQRESDLRTMTFCFLNKARLDSNRFLSEIFTDKEVRKHLFLKDGWFFSAPIYEGENSYSYEDLVSVLPQEIVGSFLCAPQRRDDLARWGKELMERRCAILQSDEINRNSAEELRFTVNREVLQTWASHNTSDFLQLADEYFTLLSKSGWYCRGLYEFMDNILCLLLRFQPTTAMQYYRQSKAKGSRTIFYTYSGVESFFAQLWRVEECNLPGHQDLRLALLEECLNDEEIMFMTLAALAGKGEEELWNLVTEAYLASPYAKERNLGVSILPWFGNAEAIKELERLKSEDSSLWVREHATWGYEVAQQERSCREVYREALQTRDLFKISAVFEQIKPALSPTARWWREIEHKKFREQSQDIDPRLAALVDRFWHRWGNSQKTKRNIEIFGRKLKDYCRGEKLSGGSTPRLAPWWKPSSD